MRCPRCGTKIRRNENRCSFCGLQIGNNDSFNSISTEIRVRKTERIRKNILTVLGIVASIGFFLILFICLVLLFT